jgi:hypothetical protein
MVEMQMAQDDSVDERPRLSKAKPRENARPAIEQQPIPTGLDEVAGLGAAGIRPRGGASDDGQSHDSHPWLAADGFLQSGLRSHSSKIERWKARLAD